MTTHTQSWNVAFEAIPANTDDANEGAQRIRSLKRDIRERLAVDHEMELMANSATADGRHKKVTFVRQDSEPTNAASQGFLYTYNNTGSGDLHFMNENGATIRLSDTINTASGDGITGMRVKIIEIGDWNMDTTATNYATHGLTLANIRSVSVMIRNDDNDAYYDFNNVHSAATKIPCGFIYEINADAVRLDRMASELFDAAAFDATSYNRGWVTIWYTI